MSYNSNLPADTTAPEEIRENFRSLKEDKIVAAASATTADSATTAESCTGNAATATKLATARAINGVSFDGSADITITAAANGGNSDTVGGYAPSTSVVASTVAVRNSDGDLVGNITGNAATATYATNAGTATECTGNAATATLATTATTATACSGNSETATKLATARTISLTGDAKGSATFDGSADASIAVDVTSADTASTCTGNAFTATQLATARTINGVSFDGSANIAITTANGGTIATTDQIATLTSGLATVNTTIAQVATCVMKKGTIANGNTIPLPDGYTQDQCIWGVMSGVPNSARGCYTPTNVSVTGDSRIVTAYYIGPSTTAAGSAYYWIMGVK